MSPRRFISGVTHEAAAETTTVQRTNARLRSAREQVAIDRGEREAKERKMAETLDQIPKHFVARGVVGFDGDGRVRESFSCACGKNEHGHNPFAGITEPTSLEFLDVDEVAQRLAERVNRVRSPKTPPAAFPITGSSSVGRANPRERRRR